ncbi:MAG TPA: UDP-N-acetylmuramoyl-tripeptide--D-alanyl-D-alanine ligase [Cerasibacillus sp.]|uniref:UDP-N-acetylmuramoyl-tripeptide--D-alanyl-D- alanine ligase n=1 Tax=Cerasibacillus sp. TaxID=2498711 RepID=UPI002F42FF12
MLFTIHDLIQLFPNINEDIEKNTAIQSVSTDSRQDISDSLFVPIIGETFDGHDYLLDAIANGAIAALWEQSKKIPASLPNGFPLFLVDDTISALQQLSQYYRRKINPFVIGITGSNGKTTTKDLVGNILSTTYKTHVTEGNFNNHIGLPLTILSMPHDTKMLVLEMGMSHAGEIALLSNIAEPDVAIITNIGESHIEYLGSRENIAKAKLEVLIGLKDKGLLIVDGDEPLLAVKNISHPCVSIGTTGKADMSIKDIKLTKNGTDFTIDQKAYHIPLYGIHHAKNAAYAIVLGKHLNIDEHTIKKALHHPNITRMRFEMIKGINNVTLINDAYNASPTSMKASIEVMKQLQGYKEKVLVLGDMFELGAEQEEWHRSVAHVIDEDIDALFTIGEYAHMIGEEVKKQRKQTACFQVESPHTFLEQMKPFVHKDALILFKASRGMQLEVWMKRLLIEE